MRRRLGFRRRRVRFERRSRFGGLEEGAWRMIFGRVAGRCWRGRDGALCRWGERTGCKREECQDKLKPKSSSFEFRIGRSPGRWFTPILELGDFSIRAMADGELDAG